MQTVNSTNFLSLLDGKILKVNTFSTPTIHGNNRWSTVVLHEVGGRKGPQIISLLGINPQRKERKKGEKNRRGKKQRRRKHKEKKRGERRENEFLNIFGTTHLLFFHLDDFITPIIISTNITDTYIDKYYQVPHP